MGRLQNNNRNVIVPSLGRADEIGVMARAVESFRQSLIRVGEMEAEQKAVEARAANEQKLRQ